jgi:uncharacterized protein (TIGR04255 family)
MFEPAPVGAVGLVKFYDRWRAEYPVVQEVPALPPMVVPGFSVEVGTSPIRLWLLTLNRNRLVQIQRDRLVVNWRRTPENAEYPRYDVLRRELLSKFTDLTRAGEEFGKVSPSAIEVTYVNIIVDDPDLKEVFSEALRWGLLQLPSLGKQIEANASQSFDATEGLGGRAGNLVISQRTSGGSPVVLQLTCQLPVDGVDDALAALDRGHEHIVRSFTEITSQTMHERWGRTR